MSLISSSQATCSSCGAKSEIKIYRSINIAENPELKDKVKDGSLFLWNCPECGKSNLARYESLYHDPQAKLMVWLLPGGDLPESEMSAISNHAKAMGEYTLRRVSDVGSLMEKVLIRDAGLDDVVVELCKFVTRQELGPKNEEAVLHFYRRGRNADGQEFITFSFIDGASGQMVGCNIGLNVYEDCCGILSRNPSIEVEEGFARVDSDWVSSLLG